MSPQATVLRKTEEENKPNHSQKHNSASQRLKRAKLKTHSRNRIRRLRK